MVAREQTEAANKARLIRFFRCNTPFFVTPSAHSFEKQQLPEGTLGEKKTPEKPEDLSYSH
jgi:hypothetical protein